MRYILLTDLLMSISENAIDKITRNNETKLEDCEEIAIGYLTEKLSSMFQIAGEFSNSSRNATVVRWCVHLMVYFLYQAVPDNDIPERVIKNYDDVVREIERVASGRDACSLPRVTTSGEVRTRLRWSAEKKRSHNPFN